MKFRLHYVQSSKELWFQEACALYEKKLNGFGAFELKALKAKSLSRGSALEKKRAESQLLLDSVSTKDFVVLFDEAGKAFKNSIEFSEALRKGQESGRQSVTFLIGGAYGSSDELKNRADALWSLSPLTMNHMLAVVAALEQIYRSLMIQSNRPYHNE
jgi:23S rRNA (pseudouridine1915-N3)-methyltransferase